MNNSAQKTKIVIAGLGNMGGAYALPIANNPANELVLVARSKMEEVQAQYANYPNVKVVYSVSDAAEDLATADYFVAAVKPGEQSDSLFAEARPYLVAPDKTVGISVMAGAHSQYLQEASGLKSFVRAMPNMPCSLGQGMTTIYIPDDIPADKQDEAFSLLASPSIGQAQRVSSDKMVDAGTAVSGSGPAYVYVFVQYAMEKLGLSEGDVIVRMDDLIQINKEQWPSSDPFANVFSRFVDEMNNGAQAIGFEPDKGQIQVDQTIRGGIAALKQPNRDPLAVMIKKVQSKGGTTIAGCTVMLREGTDFLDQIVDGIKAAFDRGQEMGREIYQNFKGKQVSPEGLAQVRTSEI